MWHKRLNYTCPAAGIKEQVKSNASAITGNKTGKISNLQLVKGQPTTGKKLHKTGKKLFKSVEWAVTKYVNTLKNNNK